MEASHWVGLIALALGVLSLIVPLPSMEHHREKISPCADEAMILAGRAPRGRSVR